jgi:hypothetical protein
MINKDHDEIWYWYQKVEEYKSSGMKQKEYCENYEVDYKKFCNMIYRIEYRRSSHPEEYQRLLPIVRKYMSFGAPASKFAKAHDIDIRILSEMVTHLGYTDIIESMKKSKEEKPMSFIQVPSVQGSQPRPPMAYEESVGELVDKQNDIEIMITKGVKVSISPNIDSMKIIKIIELLKDL